MKNKLLISLILSIFIVGAYVFMYGGSRDRKRKGKVVKTEAEVQAQIKEIQAKIYDLKSDSDTQFLETEIKRIKQELIQKSSSFPRQLGMSSLLRDLSVIGEAGGLQILLFEPQDAISEGAYEEIPIKLKLRGSFRQVASFFYGVSNLDRVIRIQNLKITGPVNSSGVIMTETDILLTAYRILGGA